MSIDLDALVQTMRLTAGHMAPVVLMPHEALALVAEVERLRGEAAKERAAERAAVVEWLLTDLDELSLGLQHLLTDLADAIERGAHRREGGE